MPACGRKHRTILPDLDRDPLSAEIAVASLAALRPSRPAEPRRPLSASCLQSNAVAAGARIGLSATTRISAAPPSQPRSSPKPGRAGRGAESPICIGAPGPSWAPVTPVLRTGRARCEVAHLGLRQLPDRSCRIAWQATARCQPRSISLDAGLGRSRSSVVCPAAIGMGTDVGLGVMRDHRLHLGTPAGVMLGGATMTQVTGRSDGLVGVDVAARDALCQVSSSQGAQLDERGPWSSALAHARQDWCDAASVPVGERFVLTWVRQRARQERRFVAIS